MSPNSEVPKASDKGKGKATDNKAEEAPKGKDGQPQANGKKEDDKIDGRPPSRPSRPHPLPLANPLQLQKN